jgi:hypothetical protein
MLFDGTGDNRIKFVSDMVAGAGYLNDGTNNNRGIAGASNKVVCTCDPHYKCACAPPGRGQKKVSSNAPTTVPAYNNVTTASIFTQPPRDPNVSAERGELSPACLPSVPHSGCRLIYGGSAVVSHSWS